MRHADFVRVRKGQQKANIGFIFTDGVYFRADVTAGFLGGR